ncbi:hypothetical protein [[Mycoplasma] gypis]|uniref:Uncharacterized protein n=1 Tax=[Mycoplasma] gypis TaxID=92404 RepID=A0ABZ2RR48_9BACT|nr:hypothetical protein [[Mycoplasma] gypis]MBN0919423.1 hypothetical protein [[Mycoplasma] gypis]
MDITKLTIKTIKQEYKLTEIELFNNFTKLAIQNKINFYDDFNKTTARIERQRRKLKTINDFTETLDWEIMFVSCLYVERDKKPNWKNKELAASQLFKLIFKTEFFSYIHFYLFKNIYTLMFRNKNTLEHKLRFSGGIWNFLIWYFGEISPRRLANFIKENAGTKTKYPDISSLLELIYILFSCLDNYEIEKFISSLYKDLEYFRCREFSMDRSLYYVCKLVFQFINQMATKIKTERSK